MMSLTASSPCEAEDYLCREVLERTDSEGLASAADWLIAKPTVILFLVLLGLLARWLARRLIKRLVERASVGVLPPLAHGRQGLDEGAAGAAAARIAATRRRQRAETMGAVLMSVATFAIATIVTIMVLSELGVDIGPLIAGAGIVGLALGFGAQTLVRDFLAGLLMLFEDQYGIGDVVDLGEATGTVEAVTLRITRLRDVNGTVWYVRNGEILRVGNMSQNWARTVLDVSVGYGEDLPRVRHILEQACHEMWETPEFRELVLEEPEVWGVERMDPDAVVVRVAIKTVPLEQWTVARQLREHIKERFAREGIEIPFPQRVVWHRGEPDAAAAGAASAGQ
jgi:moderate conductance mechanosensitive channel